MFDDVSLWRVGVGNPELGRLHSCAALTGLPDESNSCSDHVGVISLKR
ncbi:hypothetical protein ACWDWU_01685 [Streptomyces sp. NPDC003442]